MEAIPETNGSGGNGASVDALGAEMPRAMEPGVQREERTRTLQRTNTSVSAVRAGLAASRAKDEHRKNVWASGMQACDEALARVEK